MGSISKIAIVLGATLAGTYLVQPYRPAVISGQSMAPTFENGQLIFVVPMNRPPKVGDVVLVEKDGATLIKRVAMVAGDKYCEAYVARAHQWTRLMTSTTKRMVKQGLMPTRVRTIPEGEVYITGDNPGVSVDSRHFGPVAVSSIKGIVAFT